MTPAKLTGNQVKQKTPVGSDELKVSCANFLKIKMFIVTAEQHQSTGCWELLWTAHDEGRLKKAFRMPRNFKERSTQY